MGLLSKISEKYLGIFICIFLIIIILIVLFKVYKIRTSEGFLTYPVNDERIKYEDLGTRRYNAYSDMTDPLKIGIILNGNAGDKTLNSLLSSPAYEGNSASPTMSSVNYTTPLSVRTPPEQTELLKNVEKCESIKGWNCEAFDDTEFQKYCGICSSEGADHLGKKHTGGMYLDPYVKLQELENARRSGKKPNIVPTVGSCKGVFSYERPTCDIERDRDECRKYINFDNKEAREKCGQCANNNNFIYMGNRRGKEDKYSLVKNNEPFMATLKIIISQPEIAKVKITKAGSDEEIVGTYIPNTNIYVIQFLSISENQQFILNIKYPEFSDYNYTEEEKKRLQKMVNPKRASLIRASYGPYIGDPENDAPGTKDVTDYLKNKFNMTDCSKPSVLASNDGLGGDPNPGIYKQLRLAYSDNGTDFVYAFTGEGGISKPVKEIGNFDALCPTGIPAIEAEKAVCELSVDNTPIKGRLFTQGNNRAYYGASSNNSWCLQRLKQQPHAVSGLWESRGKFLRTVPFNLSITGINGYPVSSIGPPKFGTLKGSKIMKDIVPSAKYIGLPDNLFWVWAKDNKIADISFTFVVPATLRDAPFFEDNKLCPNGPIVTSQEAAERLKIGACDQLYNGQPQGPGNFSDECVKALFISSGCTVKGKAYPNTSDKKSKILKDARTKDNLEIDTVINKIGDIYSIATTGKDSDNNDYEDFSIETANEDCFGLKISNPCGGVFKDTGPHTAKCLDYLFRNAGTENDEVGQTYSGVANRSSGDKDSKNSPVMYCQRGGSMSPIGKDGKQNSAAIMKANKSGGISAVKELYRQIHYNANYNTDMDAQKHALMECYGVGYKLNTFNGPKSINGIHAWYDGSDVLNNGTIPATGTLITSWNDKSGNNNHMISKVPGIYENQGQKGVVTFKDSWYRQNKPNMTYPVDMFAVIKLNSINTRVDVFGVSGDNTDDFNSLTYGEYKKGHWHNGSTMFYRTPNAIANVQETSTDWLIIHWSISDKSYYIYRNGVQIMNTTEYSWNPNGPLYLQFGARVFWGADVPFNGKMAEVLVYNNKLKPADREKIEGYLAWKWGLQNILPNSHSYKKTTP